MHTGAPQMQLPFSLAAAALAPARHEFCCSGSADKPRKASFLYKLALYLYSGTQTMMKVK